MPGGPLAAEQQRISGRLVAALHERAGRDPRQVVPAAAVADEFARRHLPTTVRAFVPGGGMLGGIGWLFGRRG